MSAWLVLASPGALLLVSFVLFVSALAEQRFLSPRSLIVSATRARRNTPEYAEEFVAKQFDRLIRDYQR